MTIYNTALNIRFYCHVQCSSIYYVTSCLGICRCCALSIHHDGWSTYHYVLSPCHQTLSSRHLSICHHVLSSHYYVLMVH